MANWLTHRIRVGDDVLVLADEEARELIKNETERSKKADAQTASFLESTTSNGIIRNGKSNPFGQTAVGGMKVVIDEGDLIINGNIKNHTRLTRTYNVMQENRTEVFLYRFDSVTNEIMGLWRDCIIQGDIILSREDKTELPLRSSGYYDILICKITIPAGATEITQDMIGDFRQNEYYCGYAKNLLVEIDETLTKSDAAADAAAVGTAIGNLRKETRTRDIITEKRITNLEAGLPAERWSVDDSVAYTKDVPADALPFASVDVVGGITRKTANLFDSTKARDGYYDVENNGVFTPDASWKASEKIVCAPGETYAFSNAEVSSGNWIFFDGYDNYIGTLPFSTGYNYIITIPDGCAKFAFYCRFTGDIMLNRGTAALPYEPYGLRSAPVTEVESVLGVNLVNPSKFRDGYYDVENNGVFTPDASWKASEKIVCAPGETYAFSNAEVSSGNWIFFDGYDNYIGTLPFSTGYNYIITIPDGCAKFAFYCRFTGDIMLNKGSAALPYNPYRSDTLPIPAEVQALDGYGWGVNDKVYNYIDFEKKRFVKRVGCVDLGSLNFFGNEEAQNWFLAQVSDMTNNCGTVLCAQFDFGTNTFSWIYVDYYTDKTINTTENNYVYIKDSAYTDAATFKAALSGVMLYYELAEPVITDLSDLLSDDNLIRVEGGGTVTMVNEYGYDVPSEITYQLKGAEA